MITPYNNYARLLELQKYETINEVDSDQPTAFNNVMSGKSGGLYANQWKQLETDIITKIDNGTSFATIMIKHDDGKDMISITWTIDMNGKATYKYAGSSTGNKDNPALANIKFWTSAGKIYDALAGVSEDEDAVIAVFRDDFKSEPELLNFIKYWDALLLPDIAGAMQHYEWSFITKQYKNGEIPTTWKPLSLKSLIYNYLNSGEIAQLNTVLSYAKFRF